MALGKAIPDRGEARRAFAVVVDILPLTRGLYHHAIDQSRRGEIQWRFAVIGGAVFGAMTIRDHGFEAFAKFGSARHCNL